MPKRILNENNRLQIEKSIEKSKKPKIGINDKRDETVSTNEQVVEVPKSSLSLNAIINKRKRKSFNKFYLNQKNSTSKVILTEEDGTNTVNKNHIQKLDQPCLPKTILESAASPNKFIKRTYPRRCKNIPVHYTYPTMNDVYSINFKDRKCITDERDESANTNQQVVKVAKSYLSVKPTINKKKRKSFKKLSLDKNNSKSKITLTEEDKSINPMIVDENHIAKLVQPCKLKTILESAPSPDKCIKRTCKNIPIMNDFRFINFNDQKYINDKYRLRHKKAMKRKFHLPLFMVDEMFIKKIQMIDDQLKEDNCI